MSPVILSERSESKDPQLAAALDAALKTVDRNLQTFADAYPADATENGIYPFRRARHGYPPGSHTGWTTGFWAGQLWLAYDLTHQDKYRNNGEVQVKRFADRLREKIDLDHHDIGFLYTLSCVAAWCRTENHLARDTALEAADQLMSRFLPGAGVLQAWGSLDDPEQRGRTIVDSMMNLPLLYWTSEQTGDARYAEAATRHAEQVMTHMVRPDGSTYHTFYFDVDSGAPRFGRTHQGHRDESTWSRGQAWAIYGFALAYKYTQDERFLQTAQRCADVFLANTPSDGVVYWDFDFAGGSAEPRDIAEGSAEPRDSSASAIAACGFLQLGSDRYQAAAERAVQALWDRCATRGAETSNALILHGTQNRNTGAGVDEGNLFGDYFYLEALTRLTQPEWIPYW
jgi:unsaturated chondroitin disaccharide hydrolase